MSDIEQMSYTEIMPRVGELADELLSHPDEEVRTDIEELLDWIDVFHREGLHRVVDLIRAWRGDLFLEQVEQDEIVGPFLSAYDLTEAYEDDEAPAAAAAEPAAAAAAAEPDVLGNGDFS